MKIDGKEFSSKDIQDTDLEAVKKFCQKNKIKAACIIYIDKDGESIEFVGCYFRKQEHETLKQYLKYVL